MKFKISQMHFFELMSELMFQFVYKLLRFINATQLLFQFNSGPEGWHVVNQSLVMFDVW